MNGTIKSMKRDRGFGFIRDEAGADRFFHANECISTPYPQLSEGDNVTFEPHVDPVKGQRAVKVSKA